MYRVVIASLTMIAAVSSQGCSVCGDGKQVTDPEAIFDFPGQQAVTCGVLEGAGEGGLIPLDQCALLPPIIETTCSCQPLEAPTLPTLAPVVPEPTSQPILPQPTPAPDHIVCPVLPPGGCSVCGEGKCVQNPDALFAFPGGPPVRCGTLEQAGLAGGILPDQCALLPGTINEVCNCSRATPVLVSCTLMDES